MTEFDRSQIIVGDSDQILPEMIREGQAFDLILTDPPYNLNKDFGNGSDSLSFDEFIRLSRKRIENCSRLLSSSGSILWFGIHHYIGFQQVMMYEAGLYYRRMNIWRYQNGFSRSKKSPRGEYEPFLWFSKSPKDWTFNADDVRVPYKSAERLRNPVWYKDGQGRRRQWIPNPNGAMRGDVWEYPTLSGKNYAKERTEHPTQKPESLIVEMIKAFCPKNNDGFYEGTILDPFLGSGTTMVACERLNQQGHNIRCVGIELEQKWVSIAEKRLRELRDNVPLI